MNVKHNTIVSCYTDTVASFVLMRDVFFGERGPIAFMGLAAEVFVRSRECVMCSVCPLRKEQL